MDDSRVTLFRMRNGGSQEIRVSRSVYKGKEYVDIRKYYLDAPEESTPAQLADPPEEFFKPTTKGISLPPDTFMLLMDEGLDPLYRKVESGEIKFGQTGKEV